MKTTTIKTTKIQMIKTTRKVNQDLRPHESLIHSWRRQWRLRLNKRDSWRERELGTAGALEAHKKPSGRWVGGNIWTNQLITHIQMKVFKTPSSTSTRLEIAAEGLIRASPAASPNLYRTYTTGVKSDLGSTTCASDNLTCAISDNLTRLTHSLLDTLRRTSTSTDIST